MKYPHHTLKTKPMKINKQRLNQWLSGNVAAYNDRSAQDIRMIKELCKHTGEDSIPGGEYPYYYCMGGIWFPSKSPMGIPDQPAKWFFESTDEPETKMESIPDQWLQEVWAKKEALEKANPNMAVTLQVSECEDYPGYEIRFLLNPKSKQYENKQ